MPDMHVREPLVSAREIDAYKARVTAGTVLEVVEQTYQPKLVGSLRTVTAVRRSGYDCGCGFRGLWPVKAGGVTFPDGDTMRFPLPGRAGHFVAVRIVGTP